jgi:hypothetical protein
LQASPGNPAGPFSPNPAEDAMRSHTALILTLAGALGSLSAVAEETAIDIKTDLEGQYYLVEKGGTTDKPTLVVKRAGPGFNHYTKREIDCAARTVRYLGEGESLEEMSAAISDTESSPVTEGSIPDQLAKLVCPNAPAGQK